MEEQARRDAWDQFYEWCFRVARGCPSVRKLSEADRDDCVQDVMMELVRRFDEAETQPQAGDERVAGFVRVVSRNKAADILRRRYRKPEVGFEDGSGEAVAGVVQGGADATVDQGESVGLVWEALLSLDQKVPVTSYLVFYLHTIEGLGFDEIGELFQMTADQARARSHRVKEKFNTIVESKAGARRRAEGTV